MKWNVFLKRIRYYLQYFPVTLNAFVLAAALCLALQWLKPNVAKDDVGITSFAPILILIGKTALWFVAALIAFSVVSTIICWLHFIWFRHKNKNLFEIKFEATTKGKGLWLEALLHKARRPFLGFIKGRLFYDDLKITDKFTLASNQRKKAAFWREGVLGKNKMELPEIKEYQLQGGFVFFEDMLQLFSLPVRQKIQGHFYQKPENILLEEKQAVPRKTEQTDIRIDQLRKVEGEFLNYKDFESGDDYRRVVWKVYAKNRELVVRIPEIFDPYASHIYFYASFHSSENIADNAFVSEMLNYYKNRVWSIYETLAEKEFELRYMPDQILHIPEQINKSAFVQRSISNSRWQQQQPLSDYFEPRYGSVLCISSFNSPKEIKETLEQCSADVVVYYVKLSDAFRSFASWYWFKRIFLLPPNDRLKRIRSRWIVTSLRWSLLKKEKEIEAVLKNSDVRVGRL